MDQAQPQSRVSFWEAFRYWLKLGFISFGGPAGQIAIMHRDLVDRKRWISDSRFLHALNFCMLLPGPEATQLAIYVGWLLHRTIGGIIAGAFFVLPSIFVLLALSYVYAAHGNVTAVAGALAGFKPVVVAIVVEAIFRIGRRALKTWMHFAIAAAAFVSIFFLSIPFPLIVIGAAIIGFISRARSEDSELREKPGVRENNHQQSSEATGQTLLPAISDHARPPAHTRPSRSRLFKVLAAGLALWALPLALLIAWRGWESVYAQEYRFFTQAALVTFGGAYAVLAYVTQEAVTSFGWLSGSQAVDGLALAETTPGPLIMVLQFIGFMAGWNNPEMMAQTPSAILGALIATYTTFLPCFIFIFIGAPYIEVLRGNNNLTAALSGVTAAVVGVILNLALVFGAAVILPYGFSANVNWFALLVSAAAFVALYFMKLDVLWVVLAGGLIGLLRAVV